MLYTKNNFYDLRINLNIYIYYLLNIIDKKIEKLRRD